MLVERRDIFIVDPMSQANAFELFARKLGHSEDSTEVERLAAALEYIPLAIVQAAAYILQRSPRCTISKYLDECTKGERSRAKLLEKDQSQLRRDWEAKNSILITWQISFEYIGTADQTPSFLLAFGNELFRPTKNS